MWKTNDPSECKRAYLGESMIPFLFPKDMEYNKHEENEDGNHHYTIVQEKEKIQVEFTSTYIPKSLTVTSLWSTPSVILNTYEIQDFQKGSIDASIVAVPSSFECTRSLTGFPYFRTLKFNEDILVFSHDDYRFISSLFNGVIVIECAR